MSDGAGETERLDEALEGSFLALGSLEPGVLGLGHLRPHSTPDGKVILWPRNALGRQRLIRREGGGALFVTQGLSYPFDPSLHGPGAAPLGYELAVELPAEEPMGAGTVASSSHEELANAWPVHALWFLAHCYLEDRWEIFGRLRYFGGLITGFVPILPGLERLRTPQGFVGAIVGMPLSVEAPFSAESQHVLAERGGHVSRLVMITLLTADEYAYVTGVEDSSRALALAARFRSTHGHRSSTVRPSALPS